MQIANCYCKYCKISKIKSRYLLRLFVVDLTAPDTVRLMGLSGRAINERFLLLCHRLMAWSPMPTELNGAVELEERYFGPRRVRGKQSCGTSGETIFFGLFKHGGQVLRKSSPTARKRLYRPSFAVKLTEPRWSTPTAGAATTGW